MASWYPPAIYTSIDDLKIGLMAIVPGRCPGTATCASSCPRPILTALNTTLNFPQFVTPNSQVLITTQSSAEDYPILDQVIAKIQQTGAVVIAHFCYTCIRETEYVCICVHFTDLTLWNGF
jgi:hypothetical protein